MVLDQFADAVGIVSFIRQHYGARTEMVKKSVSNLSIVRLPSGQAEPDREAFRIDDNMDFGCEATA